MIHVLEWRKKLTYRNGRIDSRERAIGQLCKLTASDQALKIKVARG